MHRRVVKKCRNPECRQSFGITDFTKLFRDNRAKCPYCGFLNVLSKTQLNKIVVKK